MEEGDEWGRLEGGDYRGGRGADERKIEGGDDEGGKGRGGRWGGERN